MRSDLQRQTSRLNGAKSRGRQPTSTRPSLLNYTRTMLAETIIIEGENPDRFSRLLADLRHELKPVTHLEDGLIEDLAAFRWRQRRLLSIETSSLFHEIRTQAGREAHNKPTSPPDDINKKVDYTKAIPTGPALAAAAISALPARTLEYISRQEQRLSRMYDRTLNRLHTYRLLRAQIEEMSLNSQSGIEKNTTETQQELENNELEPGQ